jgi:hypothetical protein
MTGVWRIHIFMIEEVPGYLALNTPSLLCRLPKEPLVLLLVCAKRLCGRDGGRLRKIDVGSASVERLYVTTVYIACYRANRTEKCPYHRKPLFCEGWSHVCCKNSTSSALRNTLAPLILTCDGDWLCFRVGYASPVKRMHVPRQ